MLKPWQNIPIIKRKEPLEDLPDQLHRIEPHHYQALGAPYGDNVSPWKLRTSVVQRLIYAQEQLQAIYPELVLLLFDCWRPIRVQKFMYEYAINQECILKGVNKDAKSDLNARDLKDIIDSVNKFWAYPSYDQSIPPPHSTGAAVDLTLALKNGSSLNMGGEIDFIGPESEPNYYLESTKVAKKSLSFLWHSRRLLLSDIMRNAGFVQHPNEWWHFSFGDQLWAWLTKSDAALYGAVEVL